MNLSDRKRKILKAVVDDYIESAQPISSKDICEKHLSDCSPATIRNELSALESMGYLVQPHISSGRIPSQKAFRLYVDELMTVNPLSKEEIDVIDSYFKKRADNIEELVDRVAKVISETTNLTS
jgi:Transcriptional regulator of heat shock gene